MRWRPTVTFTGVVLRLEPSWSELRERSGEGGQQKQKEKGYEVRLGGLGGGGLAEL